ncbi:MAG: GIY-YIG nuclease family protein [Gammaproteobacteria bacterium]|nr:GIY-YIG nuclease family protein [Gammaproteobacteria bacterium]
MTRNHGCDWFVYILRCADDTLYTGVTTDPPRRLREHNQGHDSARYTRARRPVTLVYTEAATDRAAACRREAQIKRYRRTDKLALITAHPACYDEDRSES